MSEEKLKGISVAVRPEQVEFVDQERKARGLRSVSATYRQVLDDLRDYCEVPAMLVRQLEDERQRLGLGRRDYLQHVIHRYASELLDLRASASRTRNGTSGSRRG